MDILSMYDTNIERVSRSNIVMSVSNHSHLGIFISMCLAIQLAGGTCIGQVVNLNVFDFVARELAYDPITQDLFALPAESFPDLAVLDPQSGELSSEIPVGFGFAGLDVVTGPVQRQLTTVDISIGSLVRINSMGDLTFFSPTSGETITNFIRLDLNADAKSVMYSHEYNDVFSQISFSIFGGNGIDWENGGHLDAVAVNDFSSNTFPGQFGEMKEFRGHFFFASPFGLYETNSDFEHLRTISLETLGISQQPNALAFDDITGEAWLAVGDKIHHYSGFEIVPEPSGNLLIIIALICLLVGKSNLRMLQSGSGHTGN
jgi:hypothetical protein